MSSESGPAGPPPKRVRRVTQCCQILAQSVVDKCEAERDACKLALGLTRVRERAAAYLGMDYRNMGKLLKAELPPPTEPETRARFMDCTEEQELLIRPAIASLIMDKITVTLDSILERVKQRALEQNVDWPYCRSTLRNIMRSRLYISLRKRTRDRYHTMHEAPWNCLLRYNYLKRFFEYLDEGRPFVFMDESWLNKDMVEQRVWTDAESELERPPPSSKGPRWIVIGAGSNKVGWLPSTVQLWTGNSSSEDYHTDMNWDVFQSWLHSRFLQDVKRNKAALQSAVLVIDRASYHVVVSDSSRAATGAMTNGELVDWIIAHECKKEDGTLYTRNDLENASRLAPSRNGKLRHVTGFSKLELLAVADAHRPTPKLEAERIIEQFNMAEKTDVRLLVLPVAHPQLNPVELMWADIKKHVRRNNFDDNMEEIKRLALSRIEEQGQRNWDGETLWQRNYERMMAYAGLQWEADNAHMTNLESGPQVDALSEAESEV